MKTKSDTSLIKVVHRETVTGPEGDWNLTATLTRFGGLCVIVMQDDNNECWQGENILEGRAWAKS